LSVCLVNNISYCLTRVTCPPLFTCQNCSSLSARETNCLASTERTAVLTKPREQRRTCDTRLTLIRAVGNKTYTTTGNTPSGEIKALITKQTKEPRGFVHLEFSNTSNQVQPRWVIMLN